MKYCLNCQQLVNPRKKFNTIVFILLLCCTFFGGILYLIYYAFKSKKCPMCNSTNWGVKPQIILQETQQKKESNNDIKIISVQKMIHCAYCGVSNSSEKSYCTNCGAKL